MTSRTSNPPGCPTSNRASQTIGAGTLGRPVTKLLTIDEVAEVLNVSPRTVRRLIESRALPACEFRRNPATDSDLMPATVPK
jgi:excisionase family DNA binding protein